MVDWVTYKLKGSEELSRIFRTLPQEVQRQVVIPAAKDAMGIVLDASKANAAKLDRPETPNYIPKNLAMIEDGKFFQETGSTKISVGVRKRKRGQGGGNTYYAALFLELGTARSRAFPFMSTALIQNREAVFQEFLSSAKFQLIRLGLN